MNTFIANTGFDHYIEVQPPQNLTYVIHGTVVSGTPQTACRWAQPAGGFSTALQGVHPGVYRCGKVSIPWFDWGGTNQHAARVQAGTNLANEIKSRLEAKDKRELAFEQIDLVAHSHGGNVVLECLRQLAQDNLQVRHVVLIATPHFRITYSNKWIGGSDEDPPPDWWLYYHCADGDAPPFLSAVSGNFYNVFSPEDAVQDYWSDVKDGTSGDDVPQTDDFSYALDSDSRSPPASAGAIDCEQQTNVGSQDAHSVLHNLAMGAAIGWLLEGESWAQARAKAGVPDVIEDDVDMGDAI